jgi:hypothetical protein
MTHTAEDDAPRMTEAEWQQREAKRECSTYGHDWNIVQQLDGTPIALTCERPCGTGTYRVIPPGTIPDPLQQP